MENSLILIGNKELNTGDSLESINKNIDTFKNALVEELKADKYNFVVTMDTYSKGEESVKELNQIIKTVDTFRKNRKKQESEQIDLFHKNLSELVSLVKEKKDVISDGLQVFKDESLNKILGECKDYLKCCYEDNNVRERYQTVDISDMRLKKYGTVKLQISKAGRDEIDRRVAICLNMQNRADLRVSQLFNFCLTANIEPLDSSYIEHILHLEEEEYNEELNLIIDREVQRINRLKQQEQEKAEREAREKLEQERKQLQKQTEEKYLPLIKNASFGDLTRYNLELKSIDCDKALIINAIRDREIALEEENKPKKEFDNTEELQKQTEHLKSISQEPIKEEPSIIEIKKNGVEVELIKKSITIRFDVLVPKAIEDKVEKILNARIEKVMPNVSTTAENIKVEVR